MSTLFQDTENPTPLVLGSVSPRRRQLMRRLGVSFVTEAPVAREVCINNDPVTTVTTNALAKFAVCRELHPATPLITADTMVWFEGRLLGKPGDMKEAAAFLRRFSGATQIIFTGVAMGMPRQEHEVRVEASSVCFNKLTEHDIQQYLASTNVLDRAGAYDIGEHGATLIKRHSGSYSNIMGLPMEVVEAWLVRHKLFGL